MNRASQAAKARAARARAARRPSQDEHAFHPDRAHPRAAEIPQRELVDANGYVVEHAVPDAERRNARKDYLAGRPHRAKLRPRLDRMRGRGSARTLARLVFWPIGAVGVKCYDSFLRTGYVRTAVNRGGWHWAQDFSARRTSAGWVSIAGARVYTPVNGAVHQNGWNSYWGWFATILAPDGDVWLVAHLRYQARLRVGTRIYATRQVLGYIGCTGNCTGPHLHLEHWLGSVRDNPRAPHRYDTYPTHYNSSFRQTA